MSQCASFATAGGLDAARGRFETSAMTELEQLRAEVRGLRERSQVFDLAYGGMLETFDLSITVLSQLAEQLGDDDKARQSLTIAIERWHNLLDETLMKMKAFTQLPNAPRAN
jgi:hypothetical protein